MRVCYGLWSRSACESGEQVERCGPANIGAPLAIVLVIIFVHPPAPLVLSSVQISASSCLPELLSVLGCVCCPWAARGPCISASTPWKSF